MPLSLVTGAAGFLGSHVVDALIGEGHTVIGLDDLSGGFYENVNPECTFVEANCTDHQRIQRLFNEYRFDYVFHLAACTAERLSHFIRRHTYAQNIIGSANLINESVKHNIKRFVFTSSIAVYGKNQLPMREELVPQPEDPYGISKYAIELDLKAAREMFGLEYAILRPHNVYGERQNTGDMYRNVIGIFMNQILRSEPLTIFGDGIQERAFSYVGDVAPLIAKSATLPEAKNQVINVGADTVYTINQLADAVLTAMGSKSPIQHLPAHHEVAQAYSDHTKAARVFGTRKETPLAVGLSTMATWVKGTGPRTAKSFSAIELEKNLPPSWQPVKREQAAAQ